MDVLYKNLMERLSASVPELKWIDLDQGQIDFPRESYPVDFPCCLIDFESVDWQDAGRNVQTGTAIISLRIAFLIPEDINNLAPELTRNAGLDKLKLLNKIHQYVHGLAGSHFNALTRTRQFTEKRDDALRVYVLQYASGIRDQWAMTAWESVEATDLGVDVNG